MVTVFQKQPHADTPADFHDLAVIRQRAGWQHRTQFLSLLKRIVGERALAAAFKEMDANVFFAFALGHENHGSFDRADCRKFKSRWKIDSVLANDKIARQETDSIVLERDLYSRKRYLVVAIGRVARCATG